MDHPKYVFNILQENTKVQEKYPIVAWILSTLTIFTVIGYSLYLLIIGLTVINYQTSLSVRTSNNYELLEFACKCELGCAMRIVGSCSQILTPGDQIYELPNNITSQWSTLSEELNQTNIFVAPGSTIQFKLCSDADNSATFSGISLANYPSLGKNYMGTCPGDIFNDAGTTFKDSSQIGFVKFRDTSHQLSVSSQLSQYPILITNKFDVHKTLTTSSSLLQSRNVNSGFCELYQMYYVNGDKVPGYDSLCVSVVVDNQVVTYVEQRTNLLVIFANIGGAISIVLQLGRFLMLMIRRICGAIEK